MMKYVNVRYVILFLIFYFFLSSILLLEEIRGLITTADTKIRVISHYRLSLS